MKRTSPSFLIREIVMVYPSPNVVRTLNEMMVLKCTTAMDSDLASDKSYQCFYLVITVTFFNVYNLEVAQKY